MDKFEITKYDLKEYTAPFWKQKLMLNESVMFVGKDDEAPLLYNDAKVISVRSSDLKKKYIEGKDFIIQNGKIRLTQKSEIPYWEIENYYPKECIKNHSFQKSDDDGYIYFSEGAMIGNSQISITYTHEKDYTGFIPKGLDSNFSSIIKKLKEGNNLTFLFYGDSISVGCNASSFTEVMPNMPIWPKMVVDYLGEKYNNNKIQYVNTSKGGMDSNWGVINVERKVNSYLPDVVFIGFGMNDQALSPKKHKDNIQKIIESILKNKSDTNIVIVSPMLANKEVKDFFKEQCNFEDELSSLKVIYDNLTIARVTSMHKSLLKTKRYYDMTGNNVNHPNDFLARIYCQTILQSLLGNEYKKLL